jgi:hypothetical protein
MEYDRALYDRVLYSIVMYDGVLYDGIWYDGVNRYQSVSLLKKYLVGLEFSGAGDGLQQVVGHR